MTTNNSTNNLKFLSAAEARKLADAKQLENDEQAVAELLSVLRQKIVVCTDVAKPRDDGKYTVIVEMSKTSFDDLAFDFVYDLAHLEDVCKTALNKLNAIGYETEYQWDSKYKQFIKAKIKF